MVTIDTIVPKVLEFMAEFTLPLDIKTLEITKQSIDKKGNIIFDVVSTCTETNCQKCGKLARKRYGHSHEVLIQHTSILDRPVYLRIKPVRYTQDTSNCEFYAIDFSILKTFENSQ